jgi:ubiquinone/menaquinone biosynthesis C-methylase UbiE
MSKAEVGELWNTLWKHNPSFKPNDFTHDTISILTRKIIENLPNSALTFLDIGSGSGSRTIPIVGSYENISLILLDQSYFALKLSQNYAVDSKIQANYIKADGFQLPFPNCSISCVFANGVNEHFLDPLRQNLILEMARVARPGGIVAIIVPNKHNPFHTINKKMDEKRGSWSFGPQYDFTPYELQERMKNAGLLDIKLFGVGFFTSYIRMIPRDKQKNFYKSPTPFAWLNEILWKQDSNIESSVNRNFGREILVFGKKR